jgi:tetratricopeptide (TPR) repeat protein
LFFILLIFNDKKDEFIRIRKPVAIGSFILFIAGALYFYIQKPDNALQYATKGLAYERSVDIRIPYHHLSLQAEVLSYAGSDTISRAIQQYEAACRLSPADAMFRHNLGWLYWMNQQPDSALACLSQAVKSEPNIALYHISKGLMTEPENPEEAFESYWQAVLLSPDIIDSYFFTDLKERFPIKTKELLTKAFDELERLLSIRYSSIIEAKRGKLLLSLGEIDQAYETVMHVTQIHPNLNRPWYYLGVIEHGKGNFEAMRNCYNKSLFFVTF